LASSSTFIWGVVFGAIGLGYFSYGRKRKAVVPLVSGVGLFVAPYFTSSIYVLVPVSLGLMLLPFYYRI